MAIYFQGMSGVYNETGYSKPEIFNKGILPDYSNYWSRIMCLRGISYLKERLSFIWLIQLWLFRE